MKIKEHQNLSIELQESCPYHQQNSLVLSFVIADFQNVESNLLSSQIQVESDFSFQKSTIYSSFAPSQDPASAVIRNAGEGGVRGQAPLLPFAKGGKGGKSAFFMKNVNLL